MLKPKDPKQLVEKLLKRSDCRVQVACCLSDKKGIFAWGNNHAGFDGMGCHAEIAALQKANPKRVSGAVLWVAGRRKKSKNSVNSRPCAGCWPAVKQCLYVVYRDKDSTWKVLHTGRQFQEGFEER